MSVSSRLVVPAAGPAHYDPAVADLSGKLLVAGPDLTEGHFARGVILLLRHGEDGALGLVLNRPLEMTVSEAIGEEIEAAAEVHAPLHVGGPCQGPLTVLHEPDDAADGPELGEPALGPVRFSSDRDEITRLMRTGVGRTKYLAGYSGWGARQLEMELAQDAWLVADARPEDAFAGPELWRRVMTRLHVERFVPPDRVPPDPSVN